MFDGQLQTNPTNSAGEKGGSVLERLQMSKAIHSAGPTVVSRDSEEIKGSPKFRRIGSGVPAVLTGLFERALGNLSDSDLEHLAAGLSDDAMRACRQVNGLCEGIGVLILREPGGPFGPADAPRSEMFQSPKDLSDLLFLIGAAVAQAGGLLEVACDAENALFGRRRDRAQASARSAG